MSETELSPGAQRRVLARRLGVAAVVLAAIWLIHLLLFLYGPGDAAAFVKLSLFALVLFVGSGAALGRFAGLDLRDPRDAALAPTLGWLYCDLIYFLATWLHAGWLFWPLGCAPIALLVVRAVVRRRSDVPPALPRGSTSRPELLRFSWPNVALALVVLAWLTLVVPRISYRNLTMGPDGLRLVTPYVDQASYLANAAVLEREVPPENHDLAGVPSSYHYFGDLTVAMLSKATGTELITTYRFIFPMLLCLLLLGLISLAWTLSRSGWAVFCTCLIVLFGGDFSLYAFPLLPAKSFSSAETFFNKLYLHHELWGNSAFSWLNSLPQLAGTAVALVALGLAFRYREKGALGLLAAAGVAAAMLLKFKSPHFFVILGGLAMGGAFELWRERRWRLLAVAALAAALAAPALIRTMGAEERPTVVPAFFPYMLFFSRIPHAGMPAALWAALAICSGAIGFVGLRLLAFVPGKGIGLSPASVTLFAAVALGLGLFFFTVEPPDLFDALNTLWPGRLAVTLLAIPAGAGLAAVLSARGRRAAVAKTLLLIVTAPVLAGGAGLLWAYPKLRVSVLHPEAVAAYRYVREQALPGSRLLTFDRKVYAPALSEHSFYVNPWGLLAYTRRNRVFPERKAEMESLYQADAQSAHEWLRRNRIEFIFTPRDRPLPQRLQPAVLPVMSGPYGTLWRASWALQGGTEPF